MGAAGAGESFASRLRYRSEPAAVRRRGIRGQGELTIPGRALRGLRRRAATVSATMRRTQLPLRCRLDLLGLALLERTSFRETFPLHFPPGPVFIARATLEIDRRQFDYIFDGPHYEIDYDGAAVLDVGAHKGYFAAYALTRGAAEITSFEPESQNFRFLRESAARARRRGARWQARKEAVGAAAGETDLFVSAESWGHSLMVPAQDGPTEGRRERVQVVALEPLLAAHTSKRLIVKVNVEGAECDIVLGTPATAWRRAHVVIVELHPWAPCSAGSIEAHLAAAGFLRERTLGEGHPVLHFGRDPAAPQK
jgi:FkbM family methyltransferase